MSARGAAVRIKVEARTDGDVVTFAAPGLRRSVQCAVPRGWLQNARVDLSTHIADFKATIGSEPRPDLSMVKSALQRLNTVTRLLAGQLAQGGTAGLYELREFFRDAVPVWSEPEDEIPLVWVEGSTEAFPFEWLPLLDLAYPAAVEDVEVFARRFVGFSAVVRREAPVPRPQGDRGLNAGGLLHNRPLPLTFAWFADLPGARQEHEFFLRMRDHIELNGPWPPEEVPRHESGLETLTDILFDPQRRFHGGQGDSIQIEHFACHSDTGFSSSVDYQLRLAGGDGIDQTLTIGELNDGFDGRERGAGRVTRPLVFLNGCESARLDETRVSSWPEWFLDNGHIGVIGTETVVPDKVAARYAERFYTELLGGRTLGEALVRARRYLLGRDGNPLGVLYVLYADPDMTVDNPIPTEMLDG